MAVFCWSVNSPQNRSKISAAVDSGLHASCKAGIYGRISPRALEDVFAVWNTADVAIPIQGTM